MGFALVALCSAWGATVLSTQLLTPARPVVQHATATASVSGSAAPGARLTLWVDITPNPGIHIYAPGAKGFSGVSVVMTPHAAATVSPPTFPAAELYTTVGVARPVPVYRKPFRIAQPITLGRSAKAGDRLTFAAAINYQACDDRLCYPEASLPVLWNVTVK